MHAILDLFAERERFLSRLGLGLGIVFAAYYWLQLTATTGAPVDAHAYWIADPNNLYPHPELLHNNGYNYSPAFELVAGWGRLLPFETFAAIWRALILVALLVLAGPLAAPVMFLPPVASEINAANIQLFMALAIVVSFRGAGSTASSGVGARSRWSVAWPATWAFVLLTKVTPGLGLLWFALRREWRALAVALGVTAAIAGATFLVWPDRWFGWFGLLSQGSPPPVSPYYLPLLPRLAVGAVIVAIGAWRGWRWPVIVGATLALPVFFFLSPSMLVGVLPFVREAFGRWASRRRESISAGQAERLHAQGNPETDGMLAG